MSPVMKYIWCIYNVPFQKEDWEADVYTQKKTTKKTDWEAVFFLAGGVPPTEAPLVILWGNLIFVLEYCIVLSSGGEIIFSMISQWTILLFLR